MSDNLGPNLGPIIERARATGSHYDFAKLLSALEIAGIQALTEPSILHPKGFAPRIGITGPPGAGKSTLMSGLVKELARLGKKVGVIAVDPSSPRSQGAILGDRIRYGEWITNPNVFVRSIGTRGSLGGLSSSVYLMLRAFDLLEFDIVLVETVGVGQTEVEIMNAADFVVLVLVPESGDSIQAMKSGVLEIADVVVVNKSDRPGAAAIKHEIEGELMSRDGSIGEQKQNIEVFSTVATEEAGVLDLAQFLMAKMQKLDPSNRESPVRLRSEARALLRLDIEKFIDSGLEKMNNSDEMLSSLQRAHGILKQS